MYLVNNDNIEDWLTSVVFVEVKGRRLRLLLGSISVEKFIIYSTLVVWKTFELGTRPFHKE